MTGQATPKQDILTMTDAAQSAQMTTGAGFIAALDQSGGSTPKALGLYGIADGSWADDAQMFDMIHDMRARIAQAPAFTGDKVIGAILFAQTMDRDIAGKPAARFLWEDRHVVPFLKIDQGLQEPADGVRLLKDMPGLDALLDRAVANGIFGTKARSVIDAANPRGIAQVVAQQFDVGLQVLARGLVPILEPEVTITAPDKAQAEAMLLTAIHKNLDILPDGQRVMLKLTLPDAADLYAPLVADPRVMRVVALSGGYDRTEANRRLALNHGIIASFSRALTEGLSVDQSDTAFNATIAATIDSICAASNC